MIGALLCLGFVDRLPRGRRSPQKDGTARRVDESGDFWSALKILNYLLVHFGVVQHADQLFEKELACNLFVERCVAAVDKNIEDAEREENHSHLRHL